MWSPDHLDSPWDKSMLTTDRREGFKFGDHVGFAATDSEVNTRVRTPMVFGLRSGKLGPGGMCLGDRCEGRSTGGGITKAEGNMVAALRPRDGMGPTGASWTKRAAVEE